MKRRWQFLAVLVACLIGSVVGAYGVTALLQPSGHVAAQGGSSLGAGSAIDLSQSPRTVAMAGSANAATDALIRSAQAAVKLHPDSASYFTNLALAYIQKERETSDVTYYTLADGALQGALRLDPSNYAAINAEAWVALGRHDFARAAALAHQAIALNRYDSANYGTLGDAESNLGNYQAMAAAYQQMVNLKPGLASYNRASYARWLYGDLRNATRYMLMAIHAGSTQRENVAWCQSQLGDDYFNAGFVVAAEYQYRAALRTFPHYARALAGLATVEAALGHPRSAIHYYQQAIVAVPLPQYVIGLGDLYTSLGNRKAAARQYALISFMNRIFTVNHVRFGIELAQFDADHNTNLAGALRIARDTARERHDVQTMDTLAWVLYKNGRYAQAWKAEKQALRLGTHFAPYYFHAGMIQAALGNVTEAQSYLSSALMLNPNFSVLYVPVARAELAHLNAVATAHHADRGR